MAEEKVPPFFILPSELIHHVLTFLPLKDLLTVGLVNRALLNHSRQDTLYHAFVQFNVPGSSVPKPEHLTWRELFKLHHPYWFIPKNKIWFADIPFLGKLLIARYDHRLNAIEAYALVAERRQPTFQTWERNPDAIIHTFHPRVQLDLNTASVRLDKDGYENATGELGYRLRKEIPMSAYHGAGLHSRLMLTKPWPQHITTQATPIWPPLTIPSPSRARNDSPTHFRDPVHRPAVLSELSTANFRLKRWVEFSSLRMRVGEDITTWATLPEECYTPTPMKPWQGIWCGDYAGHGCEFLVVMQPDSPKPLPQRAEWALRTREREGSVSSDGSWSTAPTGTDEWTDSFQPGDEESSIMGASISTLQASPEATTSKPGDEVVEAEDDSFYRGRIEAVKLTGDVNVPRGEYSFIAPDIGPNGLIRIATEDPFKGARIVKSVGHIAARGFRDGKCTRVRQTTIAKTLPDDYMTSQLILVSHDRIAQYWETFGHVSYYQRVDIDEFTKIT